MGARMPDILLIEDEPIIARNIGIALGRAGHRVTHAASATEARRVLAAGLASGTHPDLVIADISLGDGDGIEVLSAHGPQLRDCPVIIMSGQDSTANRLRAEGISVAAFLAKPFAMARLCELAAALLAESLPEQQRKPGPSVMMYSHDTIGLGHMRRNSAIAEELVARVPGLSVLMLVGCPAGMMFAPRPGIDYIKLPSLAKLGRDRWQSGSLRIDAETARALRAGILERVAETFKPDVFLVDHEPTGVWNELVAPLRRLRESCGTRTILGLRDILDDPDRTCGRWAETGTDKVISTLYDDVLIYGNADFYPSSRAYGLDRLRPDGVQYCGAVTTVRARRSARREKGPRRVLVSGGGGRDAFLLLATALEAQALLPRRQRPDLQLIAGPLMDTELRERLHLRAAELDVTFHDQVSDMPARLAASDLFVTMGGYNSVTEALAIGVPALVVPRVGPSSEQRIRADRLRHLGLAEVIERPDLTPQSLAPHLSGAATRQPVVSARLPLDFDGAARAASHIAACLGVLTADRPAPLRQVSHG
ncbi:hypothetical protein C0V75_09630 [Tabrizicola sp. TH137]|nr:hypothetical protein C0V75_09630 [Tabrizicola sp. TH137]